MKRYQTANRLFLASAILFGAAVILQHASPWSGSEAVSIFYFLAQSCLIGCCADWIAVEALFRRRFHLPYKPLIPSNQDAVIRKLSAVSDSLIDKTGLLKGALGGSVMELADREFFHNEKVREAAESFLAREGARFLTGLVSENKEKAASLADGETGKVISLIAGKAREEILARMSREEWLQKLLALVGEKAKTAGAKEALAGAIKKAGEEQMQLQLAKEFVDTLRSISAALLAGFSIENAWKEAEKEILALYGKRSYMYQEVKEMNCSISLNQPLELLLGDFSTRSGNMDIASFSEVFSFAKRSGGNFVTIIDATSRHMRVRHETEREIQVQIASRKMEQKVMNVIPLFILLYLKVTSMDFLNVLYGNVAGALFMTVCLAAYGGAIVLAEKIMTIHM